jgi:anti-sigma factor RsiW
MSVPKEVLLDLLPMYLAGEVSPSTRAWLEERLAEDPELARQVHRQFEPNLAAPATPPLPPELELRALRRTRRLLTKLRWLFGFGMGLCLMALSFEIDFHPLKVRALILDYPVQLVPVIAAGVACWIAYFRLKSRLRTR